MRELIVNLLAVIGALTVVSWLAFLGMIVSAELAKRRAEMKRVLR